MDALMSSSMQFLSTTEAEYMQLTQAAEESYPVHRLVLYQKAFSPAWVSLIYSE
jgi:hypothetical protein